MRLIDFDWESGTATIEWLSPTAGLIRFLYPEPNKRPFRGVCSIHITGHEYEFKGMCFHEEDDKLTHAEDRDVKRYLASLGLVGISRRLKEDGRVVVKQYRHRNQLKRRSEMAGQKVKISMEVTNDDNSKFCDVEVNYSNVSPAGVVLIEDKLLGALNALHDVAKESVK